MSSPKHHSAADNHDSTAASHMHTADTAAAPTNTAAAPPTSAKHPVEVPERYPFTRITGRKVYSVKGNTFDLPEKFTITARLGQGSYGMVVQVIDTENGAKLAIKKCSSVFKYPEDGKRVLREIKLMQLFEHRNILGITDVLAPTAADFDDVYMVTICMDTDLGNIIRSQTLSEGHCKYVIYQILRGLKYIHSANVLHRDLKPANILINFDCRIKICDFGLARGADPGKKQNLTNYVVTRWYRAPELLLENTRYNAAVDIWATGCIYAEMVRGSAIFPGESSLDQMHRVADTVGVPASEELWWVQSAKAREYLKTRCAKENRPPAKDLRALLPVDIKPLALDFIKHMLVFNPYKRWSAEWLLDHPYLADCHRPESCHKANCVFKWKWDSEYPDKDMLRQLFWKEMAVFHPSIAEIAPVMHDGDSPMRGGCEAEVTAASAATVPAAPVVVTSSASFVKKGLEKENSQGRLETREGSRTVLSAKNEAVGVPTATASSDPKKLVGASGSSAALGGGAKGIQELVKEMAAMPARMDAMGRRFVQQVVVDTHKPHHK